MKDKQCNDRVCIESLSQDYIEQYLEAFSESVRVPLRVQSIESERDYLKQRMAQKAPFFFVITIKQTGQLIGAIEIRDASHRSQLYCWINEKWWGSGLFQKVMELAAQRYFSHTENESISARVDCSNKRSLHALEKNGFALQGISLGSSEKQYSMVLKK